jgi:hypothetical protein
MEAQFYDQADFQWKAIIKTWKQGSCLKPERAKEIKIA